MSDQQKDTIYIDIDDEITSIIDKVTASPKKIIALVLPKRAAVLQSVVNMKLLKRSSDEAKKNIVLITSEAGLLPIAGAVGLHTAKTLQSKPIIPPRPDDQNGEAQIDSDEVTNEDEAPQIDLKKSIGALAGLRNDIPRPPADEPEETLEVDEPEDAAAKTTTAAAAGKLGKKLKIPDFNKFKTRVGLGVLAVVLLIVGWFYAFVISPHATITINTDSTTVNAKVDAVLDSTATTLAPDTGTLPATIKTYKKTDTAKVPATGQKDNGTKASGTVTMSIACSSVTGTPPTIPAGTGVSAGGLTFITQSNTSVTNSDFSNGCRFTGSSSVVAQANGDQYNLAARSDYKVANHPELSASGTAMTGGTSKIIKVVSAADIDTAKQSFTGSNDTTASDQLKKQFDDAKLLGITNSLISATPVVTTSPNVGEEATEVTVTSETDYTMFGAATADIGKLLDTNIKSQIDQSKQNVLDNGVDKASFNIGDRTDKTLKITINSVGLAGAQLNADQIKKQSTGKKKGDVINSLQNQPGVKDVVVNYSPFWVSKTPKSTKHIAVVIKQPAQTK